MPSVTFTKWGPIAEVDGIALAIAQPIPGIGAHPQADDHEGRRAGALRAGDDIRAPSLEPEPVYEEVIAYV